MDTISGKENEEEILVNTWSCKSVHAYSTITIPSIEAIAGKNNNDPKPIPEIFKPFILKSNSY